jgi:hypothetical protein
MNACCLKILAKFAALEKPAAASGGPFGRQARGPPAAPGPLPSRCIPGTAPARGSFTLEDASFERHYIQ